MTRRWIRLDAGWEESDWLHELAGDAAGCWPRLLCWVKLRGKAGRCRFPSAAVLAHTWRVSPSVVEGLLAAGLEHGALTREGGDMVVVKWEEFQEPDRTGAARQAKWRNGRNGVTGAHNGNSLSVSMSPEGVVVEEEGSREEDHVSWMHAAWQEELGLPGRAAALNTERRQKYQAMYDEQLAKTPDARVAWRAVLWAVKQSEHHMSTRSYQMPESFLKSESRRERWVLTAIDLMQKGPGSSKQEQNVIKIREYLRRSEA